jgi:hypothetical protein
MTQPILRPAPFQREACCDAKASHAASEYPAKPRSHFPGWRPLLVRNDSFEKLQEIQRLTTDPAIDLCYLADACVQLALEAGNEAIVQRVFDGFRRTRKSP